MLSIKRFTFEYYFKIKNNPQTYSLKENKKNPVDDSYRSVYSRKVAETIKDLKYL